MPTSRRDFFRVAMVASMQRRAQPALIDAGEWDMVVQRTLDTYRGLTRIARD